MLTSRQAPMSCCLVGIVASPAPRAPAAHSSVEMQSNPKTQDLAKAVPCIVKNSC
jgi:hypothetical protein